MYISDETAHPENSQDPSASHASNPQPHQTDIPRAPILPIVNFNSEENFKLGIEQKLGQVIDDEGNSFLTNAKFTICMTIGMKQSPVRQLN